MKREIKFRAWDKLKGGMYDCDDIVLKLHGFVSSTGKGLVTKDEEGYYVPNGDFIIMQYTGSEDKNGKEIYEGDIVKRMKVCYDWDKEDGEERYEKEEISFIEYRSNGFWVNSEDFGYEGEDLWDWNNIEVIGNIYENKEGNLSN